MFPYNIWFFKITHFSVIRLSHCYNHCCQYAIENYKINHQIYAFDIQAYYSGWLALVTHLENLEKLGLWKWSRKYMCMLCVTQPLLWKGRTSWIGFRYDDTSSTSTLTALFLLLKYSKLINLSLAHNYYFSIDMSNGCQWLRSYITRVYMHRCVPTWEFNVMHACSGLWISKYRVSLIFYRQYFSNIGSVIADIFERKSR